MPQTSVIPSYSLGLHQACPNSQSEQVVTPVTLGRQQTSGEGLSIENSAQWPNPGTSIQEDAKTPKDADLLDENIERKGTFQARKYQMDFYRVMQLAAGSSTKYYWIHRIGFTFPLGNIGPWLPCTYGSASAH